MWPWSTIRRLRAQLADIRASWTSVNEQYETLDDKYRAALKAVDTAQRETAEQRQLVASMETTRNALLERTAGLRQDLSAALAERDAFENEVADLRLRNGMLDVQVASLEKDLAEASKNDKRDPATGRFVKASA